MSGADDRSTSSLMDEADRRSELVIADLCELVNCESPSADLDAVAQSAALLARIGELRLGVPAELIVVGGVTHVRWRFGASAPEIVLVGHHDTVWPRGTLETIPWTRREGLITGPGCFDMKLGVLLAMHAVAMLAPSVREGISILITGDEEVGSGASRALIETEAAQARAVLVTEGAAPGGALKVARRGMALYTVRARGVAAHSGVEPHLGRNATVALAEVVGRLRALEDEARGTSVTPTVLASGSSSNTVPDEGVLNIDVRYWSDSEGDRVRSAISLLCSESTAADVTFDALAQPPFEEHSSVELFARAVEIGRRLGLPPVHGLRVGGTSDANFTAALGIPTLDGLGAIGHGAHAVDETVEEAGIAPRLALLSGLLADLSSTETTR